MGSGVVAAADEGSGLAHQGLHGFERVLHALDARGIRGGSDDHEVVVHERNALGAVAVRDEFLLQGLGVHQDQVHAPLLGNVQGGAGACAHSAPGRQVCF